MELPESSSQVSWLYCESVSHGRDQKKACLLLFTEAKAVVL